MSKYVTILIYDFFFINITLSSLLHHINLVSISQYHQPTFKIEVLRVYISSCKSSKLLKHKTYKKSYLQINTFLDQVVGV